MDLRALPGITDYHDAWDLQRAVHDDVVAGTRPDTLILVEHPDVYPAGRRPNRSARPDDAPPTGGAPAVPGPSTGPARATTGVQPAVGRTGEVPDHPDELRTEVVQRPDAGAETDRDPWGGAR